MIVLIDLAIFSALFINFAWFRARSPDRLGELSTFDQGVGAVNTLILLTSSWWVVMAVGAVRARRPILASRLLLGAIGCGACFVIVKFFEYREKFIVGITLETNPFYSYYFVLTGLHLAHLAVGMGVLFWMRSSALQMRPEPAISDLESGAIFWHVIDLIWVVLFALLYLGRAS